ncbi:MAG TPA: type III-B CRISPR module-associated protein Cmr5 [Ktedonobacteraceae bacterium]|nr:type III-B CRISPR module-associated protein Cmr5 [Ktedonobacteraceae bacterium]
MQTRDQQYACKIFDQVKTIAEMDPATANSYGSMAHKLPILIHTSGLMQALAFIDARHRGTKEKPAGPELLLEDLSKTVLGDDATGETLLTRARGVPNDPAGSLQEYIYLTRQVLAALLWYKRYAQSILGVEQGQDNGSDNPGANDNDSNQQ